MSDPEELTKIDKGTRLLLGGHRLVRVPDEIAERFAAGDSLLLVEHSAQVLHVPAHERAVAEAAVRAAH